MIAAGSAEAPAPVPDAARPARFDRRWIGLAVVVAIYLGFAVAYATAIPIWQSPDEPAHFNYLAEIAETGGLPVLEPGDYDAAYLAGQVMFER